MPTPLRPLPIAALTVLALLAAACQSNRSLSPGREALPVYSAAETTPPPSEGRSLVSDHDRSSWPRTRLIVPVNALEHQPTYLISWEANGTERQRGVYPTADEALRVEPSITARLWGEAAAGWLTAFGGMVAAPVRMIFFERPWQAQRGTSLDFERLARPPQEQDASGSGPG